MTVSPASVVPGVDRVAVNDGQGGFNSEKISDSPQAASTGLGVVIADWDGQPGNEIFVGNDVRPNHLWSSVLKQGTEADDPSNKRAWRDVAALTGCAHGSGGVSTASMGIAVADFDGNGKRDIHITNFYQEPVSLFMNRGGSFEDRCVRVLLKFQQIGQCWNARILFHSMISRMFTSKEKWIARLPSESI